MSVEDSLGYQCEFIDKVPDDFFCCKCSQVARKLTFTSCCGESYCLDCIQPNSQQRSASCPACGEQEFHVYEQVKYQKRMNKFEVYCSMKERGCDWSGTLDQLDSHLDPDLDNCHYVDTNCPLNCLQNIPKNEMDIHLKKECIKRTHKCQYCAFEATYEEIVGAHWSSECIYLPLKCPNSCGVTCERHFMADHISICRLEKIACTFSIYDCEEKFNREDEESHMKENVQKHMSLLREGSARTKEHIEEVVSKQGNMLKEQDKKIAQLESKLLQQDQKMEFQEHKFLEKLHELNKTIANLQQRQNNSEASASIINVLNRSFVLESFSLEKAKSKSSEWKSPPIYTHLNGYKFCIGIDANGDGDSLGKAMRIELWPMKGPNDYRLKWPVTMKFTVKLINEQRGDMLKYSTKKTWWECDNDLSFYNLDRIKCGKSHAFILHSDLNRYICKDSLHFSITDILVEHNYRGTQ